MLKKLRRLMTPPAAVEQRSVHLAGKPINYTLKRTSRRRSIGLRIDDNGLTVNIPVRASEKWLSNVLQEKSLWIMDKLDHWQAKQPAPVQWVDGHNLSFLGQSITLRVVASLFDTPPHLRGNQLFVYVSVLNEVRVEQFVTQCFQQEAIILFTARVSHYAPLMKVVPRTVKLSSARTQWGSCTTSGSVRLNWQLIKMSLRLIDYVIVHELAHLIEMNHSKSFWKLVERMCPDYLERRKELKRSAL